MPQELHKFSDDHREVSAEESIWLIYPKKKMVKRNTKAVFINLNVDKKLKFREPVSSDPLHNFKDIKDGKELKLVEDMHD